MTHDEVDQGTLWHIRKTRKSNSGVTYFLNIKWSNAKEIWVTKQICAPREVC